MVLNLIKNWFAGSSRRPGSRYAPVAALTVDLLESRQVLSAVTIQVGAAKDTSIYQNEADLSNGQGEFIVTSNAARGLVQFDVGTGTIPEGSVVIDAVLTLNVGFSEGGSVGVSAQRITSSWGEGGSNASGNETTGDAAQQFDATWLYSSFDGEFWNTPGGDIAGGATSAEVGEVGSYEWIGGSLIDDVQAWVDGVAPNFGWMLRASGSAVKAFASKDSGGLGPVLEITYEPPPEPDGIVEGRVWHDVNVDGKPADPSLADLQLQIFRQTYFNAFGGEEYWFRSAVDDSWYYLTPNAQLNKWSGNGFELSGETYTTLDPKFYYNPSLVVQYVTEPEAWVDGRTVELVDSDGSVVATTVTTSRDLNGDGSIDSAIEGGWYRFNNVPSDETFTVRQVLPSGWSESARIDVDITTGLENLINGLNLQFRGSFFENFGGLGEKWLSSNTDGWHYITTGGDLYRWDGQAVTAESPLNGNLVANLGVALFDDVSQLTNGNFQDREFEDGDLLFRVDFGTFEAQSVSGRVWLDFDPNGVRDGIPLSITEVPNHQLQEGEEWFFDPPNDDWYIINIDGEATYWGKSPEPGTGLPPGNSGGGSGGGLATDNNVLQTEPWLNNRIVELLDSNGQVVETTTTRSIDLNGDGVINPEQERGHYLFADVVPGSYTIRTVTEDNWLQTSPVTAAQSEAISLDAKFGFRSTNSDFKNWGGQDEIWIIDSVGRWYYMLPDGDLYRWETGSGSGSDLSGTRIASLSANHYNNISLLTSPDSTATSIQVSSEGVSDELLFGNHKFLGELL